MILRAFGERSGVAGGGGGGGVSQGNPSERNSAWLRIGREKFENLENGTAISRPSRSFLGAQTWPRR